MESATLYKNKLPLGIERAFDKTINYPVILFLVGLNLQFLYDTLTALELVVIQPMEYLAFVLLWTSAGASLLSHGHRQIRTRYVVLGAIIGVYVGILMVRGVIDNQASYALSRDLFAYSYVSAIFVGARLENWKWLFRTFIAHFVIAGIATFIALIPLRSTLNYDSLIWTPAYKSWNNMYGWQYALLASITSGRWTRFLITAGISLYIVLILLFQKRTPVLALMVVIVAVVFLLWRYKVLLKARNQSLLALATAAVIVPTLLLTLNGQAGTNVVDAVEDLRGRFTKGGSVRTAVVSDGRFSGEVTEVVDISGGSASVLALGNGFGAEVSVPLEVSATGRSGNFHNGVAGIVFKGGIVLLVLFAVFLAMIVWDFRWIREPHAYICLTIVGTATLLSPFQSVMNTSPAWALILACIGYLTSNELRRERSPLRN